MLASDLFGGFGKKPTVSEEIETGITQIAKDTRELDMNEDSIDTVEMDVPFLIRALEYAREDAKGDIDLHNAVERMIQAAQSGKPLDMGDYELVFGGKEEVAEDDLGVSPKRPARPGSRHERGHEPIPRYKYVKDVKEGEIDYEATDPKIVVMDKNNNILDVLRASVATQKYNLGSVQSIRDQLRHQDTTPIGNYNIGAPIGGQPVDENQGNFAGDTPVNISTTVTKKPIVVGQLVKVNDGNLKGIGEVENIKGDQAQVWIDSYARSFVVPLKALTAYSKKSVAEATTKYQVVCDGTRKGIFTDKDAAIENAKSMFKHEKEYYHIAVVDLSNKKEVWSWDKKQGVTEAHGEADYGPEYQAMVQRVKKLAKEGPRKTVWDPVKRVYKTVPVNPPKKEQGVAEGSNNIEVGDKITWWYNKFHPNYEGIVRRVEGKYLVVYAPGSGSLYKIEKSDIRSHEKKGVAEEQVDENLRDWFKEKWVRFGPDGKIRGDCARGDDSEGKPKCLPQAKAHALGKKGRASAAAKKRREDPNPERRGPAKNVSTKVKEQSVLEDTNIPFDQCPHCGGSIVHESQLNEKQDACYHKVKARYKVWPSAYASGALVQCRKKGAKNWGNKSESINEERSFNDDDWYEIDPTTNTIVKSYSPRAFRHPFGDSEIKLPNGNIAVKGLRAKYMDLVSKKTIDEAVSGLELADVLYNGLEQKYPDAVRTFGQEVVANAVMDAAEDDESVHSMSDVDLIIDEIYSKLVASQDRGFEDNTLEEFEDPEMEKARHFAKQHYAGYDEKNAFDKYVQRSLKHSKESDFEQNVELKQLARDVSKIKQELGIMETKLYYNVIGTSPAELRKEFGMRKDRNGWFLTAESGKDRVLEAQRAFGTPKILKG